MRVLSRPAADRFQRALEAAGASGSPAGVTDQQLAALVRTSQRLVAVGTAASPRPDPDFVATLRQRLMTEAASLPTPTPAAARAAAARRAAAKGGPVVVVVGRGLPRALAGAAASALLVGTVVGVASRAAIPGEALYPVKGWLDGVAVRLADTDLERGRTYLAQGQEHISEARELAERGDQADANDVDTALKAAIDSVQRGQRSLDLAFVRTGNPQALITTRDFTARALPQVQALRTQVPAASLPWLDRLEALLHDTQQATARRLAACGARCDGITVPGYGPASLPSSLATSGAAPTSTSGPSAGPPGAGGVPAPGGTANSPAPTSVSQPGVSIGTQGATIGGDNGGATLDTGGATVNGPTISASVPVVSTTVQVPLPTVTIGTSGASATVPSSTLDGITLPGATVTLP
jgi:Domain of unknown function (DUF5667)